MSQPETLLTPAEYKARRIANQHERRRRTLWTSAWVASITSEGVRGTEQATSFADEALQDFDKRFPNPV